MKSDGRVLARVPGHIVTQLESRVTATPPCDSPLLRHDLRPHRVPVAMNTSLFRLLRLDRHERPEATQESGFSVREAEEVSVDVHVHCTIGVGDARRLQLRLDDVSSSQTHIAP